MTKSATRRAAKAAPESFLKQARTAETAVFKDLDALSRQYGRELFRVVGQRFFKRQREEDQRREEIARLQRELDKLARK